MSGTMSIPVETIVFDEMTAKAFAQHSADSRPVVIDGKCHLHWRRIDGRSVLTLHVEAEQIMFCEREVYPWTPWEKQFPSAG